MSQRLAALLILLLWGVGAGAAPIHPHDLGIAGDAEVLGIEEYTARMRADVPVVTTRFVTDAAVVVDLYLEGEERPIGVTPNHRVFSMDRGTWVEAGALRTGERLGSGAAHGNAGEGDDGKSVLVVSRVEPREGKVPVYNLEVSRYHTYFVGDRGAWVHNSYFPHSPKQGEPADISMQRRWIKATVDSMKKDGVLKHQIERYVRSVVQAGYESKSRFDDLMSYL
ncbi:MAG: hypothetical protein KF902_15180 [Phycisphaeraceae bacterium]|nr:hypothetical protein [Phycisphaeraceae bacterium]